MHELVHPALTPSLGKGHVQDDGFKFNVVCKAQLPGSFAGSQSDGTAARAAAPHAARGNQAAEFPRGGRTARAAPSLQARAATPRRRHQTNRKVTFFPPSLRSRRGNTRDLTPRITTRNLTAPSATQTSLCPDPAGGDTLPSPEESLDGLEQLNLRSGRRRCMLACSLGNRSRGVLNGNPNTKLPVNSRPDAEPGSAETTRAGCGCSGGSRATRGCGAETARPGAAPDGFAAKGLGDENQEPVPGTPEPRVWKAPWLNAFHMDTVMLRPCLMRRGMGGVSSCSSPCRAK
ncbi:uncharacterized protein LOC122152745 [Tyto alba]|uniref:uncharacterized protein LOC122152745 n=1 Tax=Tyto alba TaxID=56313 RepID=UPI001C670AD2|nr:uncharacterized protein LOC122152745 [Tyto alba]